jgi:hypothetical protein
MTARHLANQSADHLVSRASLKVVAPGRERQLVNFCLSGQVEKRPVRIQCAIDFMSESNVQVDEFWVCRFIARNREIRTFQKQSYLRRKGMKCRQKI